ncbi:MAG: hypothetical protein ACPGVD_00840 [Flavobacteriales bacterium]
MNRLFQHYEGEIKVIEGLTLKRLKYLNDDESESKNVILFWLETENKWLRIFIDGTYCGIDEYETDESDYDNDDEVTFVNEDKWVKNLTIKSAKVESGILPLITLTIVFTNGTQLLLNCDENENCTLKNVR